jgi:hypothetical protein
LRGFYDGDCRDDDLLIFSGGKLSSVQIIKEVLDDFVGLSGLKANPAKSSVFFFFGWFRQCSEEGDTGFLGDAGGVSSSKTFGSALNHKKPSYYGL